METQCLWFLSVLLLSSSQTEAEVVQSVSDCDQFFLKETPPLIEGILERPSQQTTGKERKILDQTRYKPICQTYENKKRFFTLYDTTNKIPVFSAYKFTGVEKGANRAASSGFNWRKEDGLGEDQASDDDYKIDYDRGHLYPSSYGSTQEDKCSTFALTNSVPQARTFNQGSWSNMENCVKNVMTIHCTNNNNKDIEGFLVTGAEPGNEKLKEKINIPSKMWSAFCCYSNSKKKWLASAYWADNVEEVKGKKMETYTLNQLNQQIKGIVFPESECPLETTVTDLYKNCQHMSTSTTAGSRAGTEPGAGGKSKKQGARARSMEQEQGAGGKSKEQGARARSMSKGQEQGARARGKSGSSNI